MKLEEVLSTISSVAKENNFGTPYMVGGVPRDRILGKKKDLDDIEDIDITTGTDSSKQLAAALAQKFPSSNYRTYDDGHSSLDIFGLHIDFSSNFVVPEIDEQLRKMGVSDITPIKREIYSRDFTINTLLETLDFEHIYDITEQGIPDLQKGLIRCPIDPMITIGVDARRILRAIKFAIKYDFIIEDNLKKAMLEHKEKIRDLPQKFVQNKMNEIVRLDDDKGVDMLVEYKLLPLVPLTKTLSDILIQKRKLTKALAHTMYTKKMTNRKVAQTPMRATQTIELKRREIQNSLESSLQQIQSLVNQDDLSANEKSKRIEQLVNNLADNIDDKILEIRNPVQAIPVQQAEQTNEDGRLFTKKEIKEWFGDIKNEDYANDPSWLQKAWGKFVDTFGGIDVKQDHPTAVSGVRGSVTKKRLSSKDKPSPSFWKKNIDYGESPYMQIDVLENITDTESDDE